MKTLPGLYCFLNSAPLLLDFLCLSCVIPEARCNKLLFKFCKLNLFAVYIKDAPSRQEYEPLDPGAFVSILLTFIISSNIKSTPIKCGFDLIPLLLFYTSS